MFQMRRRTGLDIPNRRRNSYLYFDRNQRPSFPEHVFESTFSGYASKSSFSRFPARLPPPFRFCVAGQCTGRRNTSSGSWIPVSPAVLYNRQMYGRRTMRRSARRRGASYGRGRQCPVGAERTEPVGRLGRSSFFLLVVLASFLVASLKGPD